MHDPNPSVLEVRHLKLIRAIADAGGVTRAAGTLFLSQSACSHQLLALERDLGTRLFDRVGKKMVPTAAGARLVISARRLLGELVELERSLAGAPDARIPLRITSSCFTSYRWLPVALAHFSAAHPQVELEIVVEATRRAVEALADDEVDFAIVTDPPRDDTWARELVVGSELVAVASPTHPICKRLRRGALRWGALHDCSIIVPDIAEHDLARLDDAVRTSWQHESGHRVAPIAVRKVPVSEALLELARAGVGVAILDRWTIPPGMLAELEVLPLMPAAPRMFYAVWRRANPRRLPIAELVAIVADAGGRATAPRRTATRGRGSRRART